MAKRRILAIPSNDDLQRMEAEFRHETPALRQGVAPIAQVAAEAASAHDPRTPEQRIEAVRDRTDAENWRAAEGQGLVLREIPLVDIDADAVIRDRVVIDPEELAELKASLARTGLRLPIEVFERHGAGAPWGLLSGYRRVMAMRALYDQTRDPHHSVIKAVVRSPEAMGGTFAAMVEENEIRSNLSQFERGRIAVIAAQQGAFANPEAAVDALFPVASKAKRSKIRSFALIFEELGDMLRFPEKLREKEGLRLAQALRDGAERALRTALAEGNAKSSEEEWAILEGALTDLTLPPRADKPKGGRPRREVGPHARTSTGYVIAAEQDAKGWVIRLGGDKPADRAVMETIVQEMQRLLEGPMGR